MERTWKADYEKFARTARENVAATLDNMDYPALERAAELILAAKAAGKRLHISGIGKPAHLAGYAASLFSSTGTPAYFLHGTEAVHGSCGQLVPGDVVIFISNSGETAEMKATVSAVKNNGCAVIGVSGNASSWLAQQSEVHLLAHADAEGGPLDRAHLHVAGLRRARSIGGVVRDGVLAEVIGVDQIGRLAVGRRDLLARFERLVRDGLGRAVRCLSRLRLRGLRLGRVILAARDEQDAGRDGRRKSQRRQENGDLCALGHAGLLFRGLIFLRLRLRDRRGFRFGLRGRLRLGRGHFQFFVFVVFQIHNVSRFPNDAPIISHHTGLFNAFSRRGVNFLSTFARRAARRARP